MECRRCASPLDRPGDYCLVCRTPNADTVVLELGAERATVTTLDDETVRGQRVVTTTPEPDDSERTVTQLRNYAGQIADEVRRKRPEEVHATGDRQVLRAVRAQLHHDFYRVGAENPVERVLEGRGDSPLEVVEATAAEKLGGSHSTLIGGRQGWQALETVAEHPHVKKIIPGPIDAGGSGSRSGLRVKATRAGDNGNVRLLVRDGSSVQENRVVTTARDRALGEHVRADLNDALGEAGLQE
ncbi:MAG: metal-binding protein [Halobacteriales archaeon SW_9_67_25]|nr:MAG: metal-binding protein [Halobacteriales archaeon SW_9_67_25]